jgi:DAK2 domain fusion protein YloV
MAAADVATAGPPLEVTGGGLREGLERALERLSEQRDRINELNVFPVPDGDTGSNMHLTLEAACLEVEKLSPKAAVPAVAGAAAHGSLMGARGNSGVILSQVLRGFSARCQGHDALDAEWLCQALQEGSRVAYLAVKRPVEGTILSVIRDAARAAQDTLESGGDLARVLEAMVSEAWAAVERSRDQMEILRQAGVVDAGGFGLAVILTAASDRITGPAGWPVALKAKVAADGGSPAPAAGWGAAAVAAPEGGFGYCTEFSLLGSELDPLEFRARLSDEAEDDSALVVGDRGLLHVHIHTPQPWVVLSQAAQVGRIERLKVEDMTDQHRQVRERAISVAAQPNSAPLGVVAVAQGRGFRELLLGLGAAAVVEGGQGMNPSTEQLLKAMTEAGAHQFLVLPNNPNLVLGAEQAARVSPRSAVVVRSRNLPQGIAALLAFDPESSLEVNRHRMERALAGVHAIEVTIAVRDSRVGDRTIAKGEVVGMLDGCLVSSGGAVDEVVLTALGELPQGSVEVVTVYRGAEVDEGAAEGLAGAIRQRFPNLEVECHDGGQALYPFILSAE